MSNLTILNTSVRQINNLFSLNDLHAISGSEDKHRPTFFVRLDTTQELVEEIQKEDPSKPVVVRKNGIGTYACMEIALAYAMWIDPKFHLIVLRAYMAMKENDLQNSQPTLPLAEPEPKYPFELTEYELEQLAWLCFSHRQMNDLLGTLIEPLDALGSRYSASVYSHHHEYKRHYQTSIATIQRLIEPFKKSEQLNWIRVIPRLTA